MNKPDDWWEPHDTRMIRKFGSKERFLQVQRAHGLGGLASCVLCSDAKMMYDV